MPRARGGAFLIFSPDMVETLGYLGHLAVYHIRSHTVPTSAAYTYNCSVYEVVLISGLAVKISLAS